MASVNAQIVARPGDNGSPPGGSCMFTGDSSEAFGPYASTLSGYISVGSVRDLARQLGVLLDEGVAEKLGEMSSEIAALRATLEDTAARLRSVEAERSDAEAALAASQEQLAALTEELATSASAAAVAAEFLGRKTKTKAAA